MSTYFLHDGRNELGPFSIDNLKLQKLTPNTPIRHEGKNHWAPAEKIVDLKEHVFPRRLKQPKDIVPLMMERATEFRQRRPKKPILPFYYWLSLLAGFSICSVGKSEGKTESKIVSEGADKDLPVVMVAAPVQTPQTILVTAAAVD